MTKFTIFLIILGLILVPISILIFWPDGPQPDDADLMLSKVELPPREENSYYILRDIGRIEFEVDERDIFSDHLEGEKWDQEFVDSVLERNKEILDIISLAAEKPRFQIPALSDPAKFYLEMEIGIGWSNVSRAVSLNSLKALNLIRQDKDRQGLERLLMSLNIAQKIQESQGTMLCYLTSQAMKVRSLEILQNNVKELDLPPEVLIEYTKKLERFKKNEQGLKTVWKFEYFYLSEATNRLARGGKIPWGMDPDDYFQLPKYSRISGFHLQPNNTKSWFAEATRIKIANTERFCGFTEEIEIQLIREKGLAETIFTPNIVGKLIKEMILFPERGIQKGRCSNDFLVSGTQMLLAIRAYEIETGNYPNQLKDLVPRFLSEIPQDPFSGQKIRYCFDEKIIWSVGMDLIDQEGCQERDVVLEIR